MYDPKLFCCFDSPVGEDKKFRMEERESNLKTGYSSINIERARDNQEPVDWGEVPLMPMGIAPLGTQSFSPSLSDGDRAGLMAGPITRFVDPDDLPVQRDNLAVIIKRLFRLQAKEVLGVMPKAVEAKALEEFWLPDDNKWNAYLVKHSTPEITELIGIGGNGGLNELGLATSFDVTNPEVQEFIKHHTHKFSFAVNAETRDILRNSLADGLAAGETMADLRKRVTGVFADMSKYRAERVARTESARAMNAGVERAWKDTGLVGAKEWNGASDMCEFCRAMDAKFGPGTGGIPLGGTFVNQGEGVAGVDGGNLGTNYGPIDYPPIHPNCRCDLIPVL
jgi:hypothetical protein